MVVQETLTTRSDTSALHEREGSDRNTDTVLTRPSSDHSADSFQASQVCLI